MAELRVLGHVEDAPPQGQAAPDEGNSSGDGGSTLASLFRGFLHGAGDVLYGGAQLGARMGSEPGDTSTTPQQQQNLTQRVDQAARQREQAYQSSPGTMAHPLASGIGRVGGNIAATAPLALMPGGAATFPGRIGAGMVAGGLGAATQPATGGDYWQEKAQQVGIGMAAGGVLGGAGRVIGPPLGDAARSVIDRFPHVASLVRGTALRSADNFNRSAVNQAFDPLGIVAPRNLKAGHGLIEWGQDRFTDAYNEVLPKLSLEADPQLIQELDALLSDTGQMSDARLGQLSKYLASNVGKYLKDGAVADGKQLQRIQSDLGRTAALHSRGTATADEQAFGDALHSARESILEATERQNPVEAPKLARIRQSYAMFAKIQAASVRRADSEGKFTPGDLLMAARSGDKSSGKRSFANGSAAMQAVAEAAAGAMSAPKVHRILAGVLGGLAGHATGLPYASEIGGATGYAAGPEIAREAVRATRTPFARALGRGVSGAAPGVGSAAARMAASRKVNDIQSQLSSARNRGDLKETQRLLNELSTAHSALRALQPR
jgi:hypothetical protein